MNNELFRKKEGLKFYVLKENWIIWKDTDGIFFTVSTMTELYAAIDN